MTLAENIAESRKAKKLSQGELAERLGVTQGMVSQMERGMKIPTVAMLERMADVLDCSMDRLVGRNTEIENQEVAS